MSAVLDQPAKLTGTSSGLETHAGPSLVSQALLGGALLISSLGGNITMPLTFDSWPNSFVIDIGTTTGRPATSETASPDGTPVSDRVRLLRRRTGLTWSQLATIFGVSRRAVHHWAEGGNMTAVNMARLDELCDRLDRSGCGADTALHAWLMSAAPGETLSRYGSWVAELGTPEPEDGRTLTHQLTPHAEPYLETSGKLIRSRPSKFQPRSS